MNTNKKSSKVKYPFSLSLARANKSFVNAHLEQAIINANQSLYISPSGLQYKIIHTPSANHAFYTYFYKSLLCIISCQKHIIDGKQEFLAIIKPHNASSYFLDVGETK